MKNEIGNTYGKLTVIQRAVRPKNRPAGAYWLCQCECGNQKIVRGADLRSGGTRSCGCLYGQHSIKQEIGNRYGRLVVLEQTQKRDNGSVCWLCQCDCGNKVIVSGDSLRSGDTKSCGCLVKDRSREINSIDRTGKKYYKLTALEIDEEATALHNCGLYWLCRCDCGNEVSVLGSNLASGAVKSCGCIRSSYGEEYIANLLNKLNLKYKKEYCLQGLYGDKGINLRFDFAILDENENIHALIEYDGEQHYHAIPHWGGSEGLRHRQENDKKKDLYCKQHNIKLIRIPYYKLNEINIMTLKEMIQ